MNQKQLNSKPKPKRSGNPKVTRYVVAETTGFHSSDIDCNKIHGSFDLRKNAESSAKRLRNSGYVLARVFPTKRFRSPE